MNDDKRNKKVEAVLAIGSVCALLLALASGLYFYPMTYGQPDFGYSFGVMFLVATVVMTTLSGVSMAVAGIILTRGRSIMLWLLFAVNLFLCFGVPIAFKLKYKPNQRLHFIVANRVEQ